MASLTRWTWVWVKSGSWWWTGRPGVLQFMGRKELDMTEWLNWTELIFYGPFQIVVLSQVLMDADAPICYNLCHSKRMIFIVEVRRVTELIMRGFFSSVGCCVQQLGWKYSFRVVLHLHVILPDIQRISSCKVNFYDIMSRSKFLHHEESEICISRAVWNKLWALISFFKKCFLFPILFCFPFRALDRAVSYFFLLHR